ncbi:DUF3467 domain-containing protein [Candidatus Parcubacteria bacterium]|nr:DUF3467 domain-containing protein [Candidatus Parcubacteria bacterium]
MEQQKREIKIKVRDEDLRGVYSNLMQILHTKDEFILDFFLVSPPNGILNSRVIMNPAHLKRMISALQENLGRYEEQFGKIEATAVPEQKIGFAGEDK